MLIRISCGTLLTLAVAMATGMAEVKIQHWNFQNDPPGSTPAGFVPGARNSESGRWQVAEDPKAPTRRVLKRQAADERDQAIFLDGLEAASIDLTVRVQLAAAEDRQGAGVVFRATDERNYYLVWLSPKEKLLRLDRVTNGETTHLQDLNLDSAEPGKWHTLRVLIHGPLMEAIFNNRQFLSGREEKWEFGTYKKGKVGLWARGGAPTYFDTVRFTNMDESTASSAPFGIESDSAPKK